MITDGQQTKDRGPYQPPDFVAERLKAKGVHIYVLGITSSVDEKELRFVSTSERDFIIARTFKDLEFVAENILT